MEETAARAAFRGALLDLVAETASVGVPTEGSVQATAAAVEALVSTPEELTPPAQERALSILSAVASKGALVSQTTADSVADSLSSVVTAVEALEKMSDLSAHRRRGLAARAEEGVGYTGGSSNTHGPERDGLVPADPRLRKVMGVVGDLATSLAQAIAVPGEEAILVTASALQARRVARASVHPHE